MQIPLLPALGLVLITAAAPSFEHTGRQAASPRAPSSLTSEVNPFIGTGGHGHTYPGPSLPFGMIQPGPDTRLTGWDGCSGYHYSDTRLFGFSHTHLSGTGIPDYADILLMPTTGEARLHNGADGRPGYASSFSHDDETAAPGYYAVTLRDYGIRAELTTTLRAGLHRYAFPAGRSAHVILDLEHRDQLLEAEVTVAGDREVTGVRRSSSWAKNQVLYFVIRFSRPFAATGARSSTKATFDFGSGGEPLLVKIAISAVSVAGARRNLDAELPGWDFDAVRRAADAAWERELSRIRVQGGTAAQRTTFYTALYHAMLAPNVYMDVDGQYRGRDFKVHKAEGFTYYSVFSLWDTFRALHPLLTLIDRARTRDFVRTFLQQYRDGGRLPVWELAANETDTMIGYHAVPVIADAVVTGIDGFDRNLAFEAMTHSANGDRFGLAAYKRHGYIDGALESESVSKTLEYAFDDWAIAETARRLGRSRERAQYLRRAQAYKHLFDPSTGFMRARVDGFWFSPFDPAEVNNHYTEGNAWQYSFFVPHDVQGLARLLGGPEALATKLDALFSAPSTTTGREQADITGLIGQYAHGNEPSHHVAYLYAYVGQPWKTQQIVSRIRDTLYGAGPGGLPGNEDCGQMSAWYVFSALGFYPVVPASTQYVVGSPLFPSATIRLESGRQFVVRADGVSAGAPYIRGARLNGAPYDKAFLDHQVVARGGTLTFDMAAEPNRSYGSAPAARPRSAIDREPVIPVPFVERGTQLFRSTQTVTLGVAEPGAEIRYRFAPPQQAPGRAEALRYRSVAQSSRAAPPSEASSAAEPFRAAPPEQPGVAAASEWQTYTGPMTLTDTRSLQVIAVRGAATSPVLTAGFRRLADYPRVALSAPYAPQYAAGGPDALVDGLRGGDDFRVGRWQGFLGTNLEATVDLGETRQVSQVSIGFLQDTDAWIFMPRSVTLLASDDGATFRTLLTGSVVMPADGPARATRELTLELPSTVRARYVRVQIERYGKLPASHPGAGSESWLFLDEIVIK